MSNLQRSLRKHGKEATRNSRVSSKSGSHFASHWNARNIVIGSERITFAMCHFANYLAGLFPLSPPSAGNRRALPARSQTGHARVHPLRAHTGEHASGFVPPVALF
jgi:hypothetical protein